MNGVDRDEVDGVGARGEWVGREVRRIGWGGTVLGCGGELGEGELLGVEGVRVAGWSGVRPR